MGKEVKDACKVIATCVKRGELTKQQGKTLMGQAKHGDYAGAMRGIERICRRTNRSGLMIYE